MKGKHEISHILIVFYFFDCTILAKVYVYKSSVHDIDGSKLRVFR